MIVCKELDKTFETKEELFKALKENKDKIITDKKSKSFNSVDKGVFVSVKPLQAKNLDGSTIKEELDDNFYYIVTNTTNILDSHNDLHVKGIWNKSAKEQNRKNALLDSHIDTLSTTLAKREDVEIMVKEIPFNALGYSYKGNTEALVYKIEKTKMRQDIRDWLDGGYKVQASVKMQYVKMDIAMKSDDKEDEEYRKTYDQYKGQIANVDDFEKEPLYFFVQREAKNVDESSLVSRGSNHVTGRLTNEPSKDTQNNKEAVNNTSADLILLYNTLNS